MIIDEVNQIEPKITDITYHEIEFPPDTDISDVKLYLARYKCNGHWAWGEVMVAAELEEEFLDEAVRGGLIVAGVPEGEPT